jgi:hypothetical protein
VRVRFLEIAEIELDQAIQWYGAQAPGLGEAFLIEVLSAADRIAHFPEAWQPLGEGVRRCRLSRFPYGLIYTVRPTVSRGFPQRASVAGSFPGLLSRVGIGHIPRRLRRKRAL